MPHFGQYSKPLKNVLNFECCNDEFTNKDNSPYKTLKELHNNGQLVYQRFKNKSKYFSTPEGVYDKPFQLGSVVFDSNFESGNLFSAYKIYNKQYSLVLQNDTKTKGFTQWYFFSVKTNEKTNLKFYIVNMSKQYQRDPAPLIYTNRTGWVRAADNVYVYKNQYKCENKKRDYYTLQFSYLFDKDETVYFAQSYPYGLSTLQEFLKPLSLERNVVSIKQLCVQGGSQCPILTFGDNTKPMIIIIARQHPGESASSFVMEGIIQYIVASAHLRQKYYFKIVPMMNPDGVIHGNSKCNTLGVNMNGKWAKVNKTVPTAQHVKSIMKKSSNIHLVLDLHESYKNQGIFFYGYQNKCTDFLQNVELSCKHVNHHETRLSKSEKFAKTFQIALGQLFNIPIFSVQICNESSPNQYLNPEQFRLIGQQMCMALQMQIVDPDYQLPEKCNAAEQAGSDSEGSADEINEEKKKKKKVTQQSQENGLRSTAKKSFQTRQIKLPVKPLQDLNQTTLDNNIKDKVLIKTRYRSYSYKTPDQKKY
ncbi:hypothetical protein pb186bvf_002237 [Paramecium bursaria]